MQNKNMLSNLKRVLEYMNNKIPMVIFSLLLAVLASVLTIIGPDRIGEITNIVKDGLYSSIDLHAIARIGIALLAIYILGAVFTFAEHYILSKVTLGVSRQLRRELSEKINKVPMSYFNKTSQGDILSRITNDVQTLQQGFSNSMPGIVSSVSQFLGCLVMMLISQWMMAICVIAITAIGLLIIMEVMKHSQRYFIQRQESLGKLNGFIEEIYSGHEVLRISRADEQSVLKFKELNRQVYEANWKSQFLSGIMQPLMNVVGNAGYVAVCVAGSILAIKGIIPFGTIVSFMLYVRLFTAPLTQIAQGMSNLQTAAASAGRIFDFLNAEEMPDEGSKQRLSTKPTGDVLFDSVVFSYPEQPDKKVINGFSAHIKPGQKCAIVGPTGAGKTTIVSLLMKFYDIDSGMIAIDKRPIADIRKEDIHNMFSMVLQDTWLFEDTVRNNLVYNMKDISDEKLNSVCTCCGLSHFIKTLPHGLDTVISDTTAISAGQKQMITIARAMLQNNPMLILDESTSSVDTRTEQIIQRAMDKLMENRTSFVIAHRLSTIKNADIILFVENGDVVESGSHEELIEKKGSYFRLYNSQFENAVI